MPGADAEAGTAERVVRKHMVQQWRVMTSEKVGSTAYMAVAESQCDALKFERRHASYVIRHD